MIPLPRMQWKMKVRNLKDHRSKTWNASVSILGWVIHPNLAWSSVLTFSILWALCNTWLDFAMGFSPVALEGPSLSSFEQNLRVWLNRTRSLPSRGEFYIQLSTIYPFQWCKLEASEICHPLKSHAISFKQVWMATIYLLPRLYTNSFLGLSSLL